MNNCNVANDVDRLTRQVTDDAAHIDACIRRFEAQIEIDNDRWEYLWTEEKKFRKGWTTSGQTKTSWKMTETTLGSRPRTSSASWLRIPKLASEDWKLLAYDGIGTLFLEAEAGF